MGDENKKEKKNSNTKLDQLGNFISTNYNKGELALKHSIGLGAQPNVVPEATPVHDGEPREVHVGWHPVAGLAGKWFADKTGLGKMITEKTNDYPDPTQHWAVLVGDYVHQLWMDEEFHVIYINEKSDAQKWETFKVGETRFNDDAIRRAGETVIQATREKEPTYNLISNNCQTYALALLDAINSGNKKEFGTTLAVYDRVFGEGTVADLFVKDDKPVGEGEGTTVSAAQQVMDNNTTKLDTHGAPEGAQSEANGEANDESKDRGIENGDGEKKKKKNIFSRIINKVKT